MRRKLHPHLPFSPGSDFRALGGSLNGLEIDTVAKFTPLPLLRAPKSAVG
jgi:hypothetical protein